MNYQVMPDLNDADYQALKEDIRIRGLLVPVEFDEDGNVLDGHHRIRACEELEIDVSLSVIRKGLSEEEKRAHARQLNIARRHLNQAQRRELISGQLKDTPAEPDRTIAAMLGVSHVTVGEERKRLESIGQIDQCDRKTSDGRTYPAKRKKPIRTAYIDDTPEGREETTSRAKAIRKEKAKAKKKENDELASQPVIFPDGKFGTIVIDPPWNTQKIERDIRPNQVAFDYPTMNEEELSTLEIPAANDCHIWLWATHKYLPTAMRLLDTWDFKYVCTFVWNKPGGFQPIGLPQYNCEFALYARKGTPKFIDTKAFNVCFNAPRGKHSEKPQEFYNVVKRVTAGNRLDMFNRRKIPGFVGWGNESG
ncbi:MAG: ParB N-terminal domain-containing protein [Chloroflexi bacterium]|nr:ParB N-terminal domain-containing protein [Chloroflexota bacterium]